MGGFDNQVIFGSGLDLSGGSPVSNKLNQDGFLYFGNSSGNPVAGLISSSDSIISVNAGPGSLDISAGTGLTDNFLQVANNLSDVASAGVSRVNLGLGSIATQNSASVSITGGTITGITDLAVADGGTGASSFGDGYVLLGSGTGAITALDVTAKGSLLVGDGTTDPIALPVGTDTFVLTANSGTASGLEWAAASGGLPSDPTFPSPLGFDGSSSAWFQPNRYIFVQEDFIVGTKEAQIGRIIESSGGGTDLNTSNVVVAGHPGILRMSTSGATARVTWILAGSTADPTDDGTVLLGGGAWYFEWCFKLSALSDASDTYTIYCGLVDRIPGGAPSDALYFSYTHGTNSGNWVITAASGGTTTTANTSTAAVADWQRLTLIVNAAGTSASFYVNGTEVSNSPLTSNLPTAGTTGPVLSMIRSTSTTSREIQFDYYAHTNILTTAR